ncbi:MAG: hypothetical protein ACREL1_06625, partial [bacterium]
VQNPLLFKGLWQILKFNLKPETSEKLFKATNRGFDPKDFRRKSWDFLGHFSEKEGEGRLFQRLQPLKND